MIRGHAFLSHARQDSDAVDRLQRVLQAAGISTWRDTDELRPGEDWRARIRRAITSEALAFIACFSSGSTGRRASYQNEELLAAIDQFRLRPADMPWLLPVRLDECDIPDLDIGANRTLASIQRVDLFGDRYDEGIARLVAAVLRILGESPDPAGLADGAGAELLSGSCVVLQAGFPADIEDRRGAAASLLLIGVSMSRTVQSGSLTGLRRVVASGGKIRVLLVDPTENALVRAAGDRRPQGSAEWVRRHINLALNDLASLRDSTGGDVEFRVARFVPAMGIHAIDTGGPDGLIVLQHYEHKPAGEPGPILTLRAPRADGDVVRVRSGSA